jgi:hypothetical protein
MVATRLTGRDEPMRSGRSEPAAAGHPPITALLSAHGPEDTNYELEDMNNEEIERAAKLSVRKSAPLEYYCASASGQKATVEGSLPLKMQRRSNFWTIYAV